MRIFSLKGHSKNGLPNKNTQEQMVHANAEMRNSGLEDQDSSFRMNPATELLELLT